MAMSKPAKRWIIIVSIPVALIVLAVIGLKLYLTSDRLKALIIPRIEEATHRTVSVADVSLSVFPSLGVVVEGVKISNPPGAKFEQEEFLSLDRLVLDVKLFPLLKSKLEIDEVLLDHPKLYLEQTKEGRKNYSGAQAAGAPDTARIEMTGGAALLLSSLKIRDGEIEFVNKKSDSHLVLSGYNETAKAEVAAGSRDIHVETELTAEKLSYGTMSSNYIEDLPLKATGRITYASGRDVLTLDSVSVLLRDLPLSVRGDIAGLMSVMTLDMTVTAPRAEMNSLLSLVPPDLLKASKGLKSSGDVKFSLIIKGRSSETDMPGVSGSFTVANGSIQYSSLPKAITAVNVSGTFSKPEVLSGSAGPGEFSVDKFSAVLSGSEISGKVKVSNFDDPEVTAVFSGTMNLDEVKEYYPLEQGTELSGRMKADVSVEGKAKMPTSLKASGQIGFENVTVKTAGTAKPLRNLNGTITFNNQIVESKGLAMAIGESDLSLSFVLRNYLSMAMGSEKTSGKPSASLTLTSKVLRTADLMPASAPAPAGAQKKAPEKSAGLVPGFDIDANVSVDRLVTEKFEFTNARGSVALSGGVATLKNFSVNAFQGTVITKGTLDARDPKKRPFDLDLQISGVEANSCLSRFTTFGKSLYGKLNMNTKLKGDLNDTLGINPQTLLGNGTVQVFDGKLAGFAVAGKLAEVTGLSELGQIQFKNWANAFEIANGRVMIKDLRINAGTTDFLAGGSQGLDGSLDYTMTVKLPGATSDRLRLPGVAGEIVQYFKDKDGRLSLSFLVSGNTASPVLKLDTKTQEDMAKKALQQKGTDAVKKKLNDVLKDVFKK